MTERPDALDDLLASSSLSADDQETLQRHADRLLTERTAQQKVVDDANRRVRKAEAAPRHLLPVPWTDTVGQLDTDTMRKLAPEIRTGLIDALRSSATAVRAARGTVVTPEDTYDLVRRLTAAQEALTQWQQAFAAAADEAAALVAEEAATANGEQDGIINGSLFVPDGEGQRIAVRNDFGNRPSVWDVGTLTGWVIEEEIADYKAGDPLQTALRRAGTSAPMMWDDDQVQQVARAVVDRLLDLGTYTPKVSAVESLRKKLAGQQRDADATVIGQVRHVGPAPYKGVKITREEVK
jgi:hypothetical protein